MWMFPYKCYCECYMCGCSLVSVIMNVVHAICVVCVLSYMLPRVIFVGVSRHTFYPMFGMYLVQNLVIRAVCILFNTRFV